MYILHSIQEFKGKKVGVYKASTESFKQLRKAEREILKKGNPNYAIFILSEKLIHGTYDLYENRGSYVQKTSIDDDTSLVLIIHI